MLKRISKSTCPLIVMNFILYDVVLLIKPAHFNQNTFLYYMVVADIMILCLVLPFFRFYRLQTYRSLVKTPQTLQLLYQAELPGASSLPEDELYDIINLSTTLPEHSCSKSDYIKYLKRKGLLIVNGQHIWLYGMQSDL